MEGIEALATKYCLADDSYTKNTILYAMLDRFKARATVTAIRQMRETLNLMRG